MLAGGWALVLRIFALRRVNPGPGQQAVRLALQTLGLAVYRGNSCSASWVSGVGRMRHVLVYSSDYGADSGLGFRCKSW